MRLVVTAIVLQSFAFAEMPAPSVHWGGLGFPDLSSSLSPGFAFDRFTPADGLGNIYDSTIADALGFNFLFGTWAHKWPGLWSTNLSLALSVTSNQPTEFMQETLHRVLAFPKLPKFKSRTQFDFMFDASLTKWFAPVHNINLFVGAGLSAGSIYKETFIRAGVRRLPLTPSWHTGDWGEMGLRASVLGRLSLPSESWVVSPAPQTGRFIQTSLSFGQYKHGGDGEIIPTWEGEFALSWDTGIFANARGVGHYGFFWTASVIIDFIRIETWNDSIGTTFISPFTDYGPTFGIALSVDILTLLS